MNHKVESADEYLRRNRIMELFEDLMTKATYEMPENLEEFLVDDLKKKKLLGFTTPIFNHEEVANVFQLFDLKREGFILRENCKKALLTMASSERQQQIIEETSTIDDRVDLNKFHRLAEQFLGLQ